jgi:hypothetical protein
MRTTLATLAMAALVVFSGCNEGTPGGPGVKKAKEKANESTTGKIQNSVSQPEETFTLTVPTLSTHIKQGESKVITIGIKRGKNFDENVALKFDNVPTGVTFDPASPTIKHGDTEAKITATAKADAAVGDFTVKVTGHPEKGSDATNELKLTIAKK